MCDVGQCSHAGAHHRGGAPVMERRESVELLDDLDQSGVDASGSPEGGSAVDDAIPDRIG